MTKNTKIGLGVGALVAGFFGYKAWKKQSVLAQAKALRAQSAATSSFGGDPFPLLRQAQALEASVGL